MHYWMLIPDWNALDSVRRVHSLLEGWALICFALLVLFDVLAHTFEEQKKRSKRFEKIGLWFFGIAILMEILAYPYGQRNDTLANLHNVDQQEKIVELENSTQRLKTGADTAKAQIADADARAESAEAQVASAEVASTAASAKAESFRLDIARANQRAADATKAAEEDRLARVKLESQLKARSLKDEQQQRIANELRLFSGSPYEIGVDSTPEAIDLAEQIDRVLRLAGWTPNESARKDFRFVTTFTSGTKAEQLFTSGISVQIAKSRDDKYGIAANKLVLALRSEGLSCNASYLPDTDPSPDNIHVLIGSQEAIK